MKKPAQRKPIKPVREVKGRTSNPTLDFAMTGGMLTQQEYDEALKGNVSIQGHLIMNVNAPLPNFPTGTRQKLYAGRGPYLEAKNFLEM